jgi:hypothetical protein
MAFEHILAMEMAHFLGKELQITDRPNITPIRIRPPKFPHEEVTNFSTSVRDQDRSSNP